jgi:hypothetical protein
MKYKVNNADLQYSTDGKTSRGDDRVLLQTAIDLTAKTPWTKQGFTVETLFDELQYQILKTNTKSLLLKSWSDAGFSFSEGFSLEQYHRLVKTKEGHLKAVGKTKLLSTDSFPIDIRLLEKRISEICNEVLIVKNPYDGQSIFHFRVIRPHQPDNNPLHRDVWLDDYKDCLNVYIPVCGSNDKSSLIIIPRSHHWPESKIERTCDGAKIGEVKYNVPAVTKLDSDAEFVRPNPKENEVLIFSPYLLHGGSANLNDDITRISIEVRLWRKTES